MTKKSPKVSPTPAVEMKLVATNCFTRWPCTACGGATEKVPILCEGLDGAERVRVCESCLEAGDIDARLRQNAARADEHATYLRGLIGRLRVPSFARYKAASAKYDAEYAAAEIALDDGPAWDGMHATTAEEDFEVRP
jgi:hypothetical protein